MRQLERSGFNQAKRLIPMYWRHSLRESDLLSILKALYDPTSG